METRNRSSSNGNGRQGRPTPVDRDPKSRPGVPMIGRAREGNAPPLGSAIEQQQTDVTVLVGRDIGRLTPVFSTAQPPRGLSGLLRRAAYSRPEHDPNRWLLLLLGDRVDVWEGRLERHPIAAAGAALAVLALAGFRPRRRRSR